jgi:hypothetical protein
MTTGTRRAVAAFEFFTLAHVTRSGIHSAKTLVELLDCLERCSDESIYHHTIQALGSHHFLTGGTSNDFAKWVESSVNRPELSARLAKLDQRYYMSIAELRRDLCKTVGEYIREAPQSADEQALAAFYFCEGMDVRIPTELTAASLEQLRASIEVMGSESFYLHFIASKTRLERHSNDFSEWLKESLGMERLAERINQIDVEECTLEGARQEILGLIDVERANRDGNSSRKELFARNQNK